MFSHTPVMLRECLELLDIKPDGIYIDGTCGGAGHSSEIAKLLDAKAGGRLIGIDRDPDAVKAASERLAGLPAEVVLGNYDEMADIACSRGIDGADGILLDLGVSSHQLDTAERGFSYHNDAPLDMRMSQSGMSAKELVNTYSEREITDILYRYGEEKFAPRIARAIVAARDTAEIETTSQLADIIASAVPAKFRRDKNPSRQSFQAIRIAVNDELGHLDNALDRCLDTLSPGGRLVVITFHSLEDRMVKRRFAEWAKSCTCPPDFPVCVCGGKAKGTIITRKPVTASDEELESNMRSRSAKVRAFEKTTIL